MATSLVPAAMRLHMGRQFVESIDEFSNSSYYAFVGHHEPYSGSGTPDVYDMTLDTTVNTYASMILGKRVRAQDAAIMVRRVDYVSNTVYDMYDDGDPLLFTRDFYASVNAGSFTHVFKCLDNNDGAPSTTTPNFADVVPGEHLYETSDGYRWKYLYTVTDFEIAKFATSGYIPVVSNSAVVNTALDGSIDIIKVEDGGEDYGNYLTGTFDVGSLRVGGDGTLYAVSNAGASVNGYYTGCLLYVSAGTGSGQHRRVTDYVSNSTGKYVRVESPFGTALTGTSQYQIYPEVRVSGTGYTENAVARALVNSTGNVIYRVEVLEPGLGYTFASAAVVANDSVGVTPATVRAIYSPAGGHGSDPAAELGARAISVSVTISNNEGNTVPTVNGFRQVGILKDPLFANVGVSLSTIVGSFTDGEDASLITKRLVATNVSVTASSTDFAGGIHFSSQFVTGDWLYVEGNLNDRQLLQVNSVTNATSLIVTTNSAWTCTSSNVWLTEIKDTFTIESQPSSNVVTVTDLGCVISTGDTIIGRSSRALGVIDQVSRGGMVKGFNTFVQGCKLIGTYSSGTFTADEVVTQTIDGVVASGLVHSAVANGGSVDVILTRVEGDFTTGTPVIGSSSTAIFSPTTKYYPELKFGSGEVLYLENISTVERAANQSEKINVIIEL